MERSVNPAASGACSNQHPATNKQPDARKTALYILNSLDKGNKTLDSILEAFSDKTDLLPKKDRSLLNALVYGVIRWRGRLDYLIEHFSNTPLVRINPKVLNIIRIGLFQIIFLSRIPVSAAVNTSVELAKSFATKPRDEWLKRLDENDVPSAPLYNMAEVLADPQVKHLRLVEEVEHPKAGKLRFVRSAVNHEGLPEKKCKEILGQ